MIAAAAGLVLAWELVLAGATVVHAESPALSAEPLRRLPPLTVARHEIKHAPALASNSIRPPAAPQREIRLASAIEAREIADLQTPGIRRLPPLIGIGDFVPGATQHRPRAAHSRLAERAESDLRGGVTVLAGSSAISHRAIFMGPPPQPVASQDELRLGRSTLHPPGRLPSEVLSPIQSTVGRQ